MTSKAQRKVEVANVVASVTQALVHGIEQEVADDDVQASKLKKTNKDGGILMCEVMLQKKLGAPDPQVFTVGNEIKWIKRGAKVKVPWYFVEHMLNNVERKFFQIPDPTDQRKRIVKYDDILTEGFSYTPINPAEGMEIEGPNPVVDTTI